MGSEKGMGERVQELQTSCDTHDLNNEWKRVVGGMSSNVGPSACLRLRSSPQATRPLERALRVYATSSSLAGVCHHHDESHNELLLPISTSTHIYSAH